jgi:myo-inositol-1-phosphate synthase
MRENHVAVVGIGNCESSLIQGLPYYTKKRKETIGLMRYEICGYKPGNVKVFAVFDIDKSKVGKPSKKQFIPPNCTIQRIIQARKNTKN